MEQMTDLPAAAIGRGLEENPDKIAFALLGPARAERWSYARLEAAITAVTGHLQQMNLPPLPVAIALGQSSEAIVAVLAVLKAGLVPVIFADATKVAGCATIIGGSELPASLLRGWIDGTDAPAVTVCAAGREIVFAGSDGTWQHHPVAEIASAAQAHIQAADISATDRVMWAGQISAPLTFTRGVIATLQAGGTLLLPAPNLPMATLALLMKRHDATIFAAAPFNLRLVLAQSIGSLPRMRHGLSFGAALPATTAALWADKTATPLRDLGPAATPADLAGFALAESLPELHDIAAHGAGFVYDGAVGPEQLMCAIATGGGGMPALWHHQGPLPRDGDGCLDHASLTLITEQDR